MSRIANCYFYLLFSKLDLLNMKVFTRVLFHQSLYKITNKPGLVTFIIILGMCNVIFGVEGHFDGSRSL